jgi:acetylornithine deacetylase/succinyl-diaminopimelate desuccinylase-like protein
MMDDFIERLLDLAIEIQQIPAPTFHETERADLVRESFRLEKNLSVEMDAAGNVLACLPGQGSAAPIVVSAHLDTVFPLDTNLRFTRESDRVFGAGIGDNSLGVAGLFGLLWLMSERNIQLPGDLWLAANVCEEGLGDLKGMRALVERFGDAPKAYLILEGMAFGHIYNRALGVRRYRISINTNGGHSWTDYGQASAVHELTGLASKLTALPIPSEPRTTLNVGKIAGGTSVNTIAAQASLELDLRSEGSQALQDVSEQVEHLAAALQGPDVQVEVEVIGQRPGGEIRDNHPLVLHARESLRELGIQPVLTIGSTDANLPLSLGLPAVTIGLTTGASAHTVHEYILTGPLRQGFEQLVNLVQKVGG